MNRGKGTGPADPTAARPIIQCETDSETDHTKEQGLSKSNLMNFYVFAYVYT